MMKSKYSRVYPECFNQEGHCLHWVQVTLEDQPILEFGSQIESKDLHFHLKDGENMTCGNPWNCLSQAYAKTIRNSQPQSEHPPTHGPRPVTTIHILDCDQIKRELCDNINGDCWSVYSRDRHTHQVLKLYYQLQPDNNCHSETRR